MSSLSLNIYVSLTYLATVVYLLLLLVCYEELKSSSLACVSICTVRIFLKKKTHFTSPGGMCITNEKHQHSTLVGVILTIWQ
jgi:hypothetical protein